MRILGLSTQRVITALTSKIQGRVSYRNQDPLETKITPKILTTCSLAMLCTSCQMHPDFLMLFLWSGQYRASQKSSKLFLKFTSNGRLLKSIVFTRIPEAEHQFLETERPVSKMVRLVSNNVHKPSQCMYSSLLLTSSKQIMFCSSLAKRSFSLFSVQLYSESLSSPIENKIGKSCHLISMALEQTNLSMTNI